MSATDHIPDPDVKALFKAGEKNETLKFLYATVPGSTTYYVFIWRDQNGDPHDGKMTKMELIGRFGRNP